MAQLKDTTVNDTLTVMGDLIAKISKYVCLAKNSVKEIN